MLVQNCINIEYNVDEITSGYKSRRTPIGRVMGE